MYSHPKESILRKFSSPTFHILQSTNFRRTGPNDGPPSRSMDRPHKESLLILQRAVDTAASGLVLIKLKISYHTIEAKLYLGRHLIFHGPILHSSSRHALNHNGRLRWHYRNPCLETHAMGAYQPHVAMSLFTAPPLRCLQAITTTSPITHVSSPPVH